MHRTTPLKHPIRIFFASALISLTVNTVATAQPAETIDEPSGETVSLTIDYGDGAQKRFPQIAWPEQREGTVADVLLYAEKHDRGVKITARGRGETRFLEAINGLKNEGAGGKNWMFLVNGELAQSSYATTPVETGAVILWKFRTFQ